MLLHHRDDGARDDGPDMRDRELVTDFAANSTNFLLVLSLLVRDCPTKIVEFSGLSTLTLH